MSAGKNLLRRAVRLGIESTYNTTGAALTIAADGFHVHDDFEIEAQYQHDGAREGTAAGTSMQRGDAKSGRFFEVELAHRVRPTNAAISISAFPTVHRLLRAHGMTGTFFGAAGSEAVSYNTFTDGTWESLYGDFYTGKELRSGTGIYVKKWVHQAERTGVPTWRFGLQGVIGLPSDASVPSGTYPNNAVSPVKANGATFTILASGGVAFQGLVRESTVTSERDIDERMSQALASGSHPGFQLGRYRQTIECLVEGTNLAGTPFTAASTLDPFRLAENGTLLTVLLQYGTVQFNRYKFQSATLGAQIGEAKQERAGSIRLWRLTINCSPTTETADDGLTVLFD